MDPCKNCGACENHIKCACCGSCRNCGKFMGPVVTTWPTYPIYPIYPSYPAYPTWTYTSDGQAVDSGTTTISFNTN